jgi:hypothetical protein
VTKYQQLAGWLGASIRASLGPIWIDRGYSFLSSMKGKFSLATDRRVHSNLFWYVNRSRWTWFMHPSVLVQSKQPHWCLPSPPATWYVGKLPTQTDKGGETINFVFVARPKRTLLVTKMDRSTRECHIAAPVLPWRPRCGPFFLWLDLYRDTRFVRKRCCKFIYIWGIKFGIIVSIEIG